MSCVCGNQPETTAPRLGAWLPACRFACLIPDLDDHSRSFVCGALDGEASAYNASAGDRDQTVSKPHPRSGDRPNRVLSPLIGCCWRAKSVRQTPSSAFTARLALHVVAGLAARK